MKLSAQKITVLAVMSALAYIFMLFTLLNVTFVPVLPFLKYDPKDIIIAITGFLYGPLSSFAVSAIVATIELFTTSTTGPVGWAMNVIATTSFTCTAAFVYKKFKSRNGAIAGLLAGTIALTAVMCLWNVFLTPIYMGMPRATIVALLLPGFIPFNLLKGALNSGAVLLLYKPVINALSRRKLAQASEGVAEQKSFDPAIAAVGAGLVVCAVVAIYLLKSAA